MGIRSNIKLCNSDVISINYFCRWSKFRRPESQKSMKKRKKEKIEKRSGTIQNIFAVLCLNLMQRRWFGFQIVARVHLPNFGSLAVRSYVSISCIERMHREEKGRRYRYNFTIPSLQHSTRWCTCSVENPNEIVSGHWMMVSNIYKFINFQ